MPKPDGALAIGDTLYLFEPKAASVECLISAHGGAQREVHFTVPARVTLKFYAWHGWSLEDPGLLVAANPPKESITGPSKSHDYLLCKYQGKHNEAAETYESIASKVEAETLRHLKYTVQLKEGTPEQRLRAQQQLDSSPPPFFVATVRNRWFQSDVKLSELIVKVRAVKPMIQIFHCSFCRSSPHTAANLSLSAGRMFPR